MWEDAISYQQRCLWRQHGADAAQQRDGGQRARPHARGEQLRAEHVQRVERTRRSQLAREVQPQTRAHVRCEVNKFEFNKLSTYQILNYCPLNILRTIQII
ncbi:unnamed protein product [Parnassius mnemosyne]|uniref:Uncharacterized protein n=1 Tax=Parnassius mnemosyne TaxID=213953 RepID=A0AAV1KTE9_9NEOP